MMFLSTAEFSSDERELNPAQVAAIFECYTNLHGIRVARDAFISMTLHCPPAVILKTLVQKQSKELEMLMQIYWLTWLENVYDWLKMFGICPWYLERVEKTIHYIPVVPPFGSGVIKTFLNKKHKQEFRWYWKDNKASIDYDKNMYFEHDGNPPTIEGFIRSPIATLIAEYNSSKIARNSCEMVWNQQARQQHIIEHHPPRNMPGDDNLVTLESFGERIAGQIIEDKERLNTMKINVKSANLKDVLKRTAAKNLGLDPSFGNPNIPTENAAQHYNMYTSSLISKATTLPPDFVYKAVPSPSITIDYVKINERMDEICSSIMDVPPNWIQGTSAKTVAAAHSSSRFVNERIKHWISLFERLCKKAIISAYGSTIQNELDDFRKIKNIVSLYADEEIVVIMPCTPVANIGDIQQIYTNGMISKENAALHIFNIIGVPATDIEMVQPPEMTKAISSSSSLI